MPWSGRISAVWGHFAPHLLVVAVGAMIVSRVVPVTSSPLAALAPALLIVFVVGSWLMLRQHDRRLCEACLRAMPLDPAAAAARRRRRFDVVHAGSRPRYVVPYLLVLIGSNFLPGGWGLAIWVPVQLSMVYLVLAYTTHRTLQPWCPWCQGGDGGHDHDEVDDGPRPDRDRQLI